MRCMTFLAVGLAASITCMNADMALGDTSDKAGVDLSFSEKPTNGFAKGPSAKLTYDVGGGAKVWVEMHQGGGGVYGRMPMPESVGGLAGPSGANSLLGMLLALF